MTRNGQMTHRTRDTMRAVLAAAAITTAGFGATIVPLGTAGAESPLVVDALETTPATTPATTPGTTPVTTPDTVPVTTPDTVPDGGGGDSDVPWPLIIAIGAVAIIVIALLATAGGRRRSSGGAAAPAPAPHPNAADQDRGYALGAAQWVHDNFSVELLSAAPDQAARRWAADRGRLDDAAIRAQRFGAEPGTGVNWQRLGQSLALLSTSLDSYVQVRNQEQPTQQLVDESFAAVNVHRAEVAQQLAELWPTVQR